MTQRQKIHRLLDENRGGWVGLPDILRLGVAQYCPRILELRRELEPLGWKLENRIEHRNGKVLSSYRLLPPRPAQRDLFGAAQPTLEARAP